MKKLILIVVLLVTCLGYSQDVSIIKSEIFKDSKKSSSLEYSLEDENGGLLTIRAFYGGIIRKIKGYYIQHFDANLKLLKEIEYKKEANHILKNAFIKNNMLHLIEYEKDKENNQLVFNAVSAKLEDLEFNKKEILSLSEESQKKYFGVLIGPVFINNFSQYDGDHTGEVIMSKSNKYFVINFDINNKETETHKVFVFNNNLEKVYEQLIQKDIKDKFFDYEDVIVDDKDGTVYFLGKSFENESRRSKVKGESNYHYELYRVNAKGQSHVSFKPENRFVSSLELVKSDDRLSCAGFYGNKEEWKINGACLFNLNPETLDKEQEKFTAFTEKFLTDKYGDKKKKKEKKKKKGIKNIDFKSVYQATNGDVVINAEEFYWTTSTYMDSNGNVSTRTIYHFDDIISVRMDKDGSLKWARNINKKQTGFATSSYTSVPVGGDSYFFINCSDNIKKLSDDRIAFTQTKAKKSNLYMIKVNEDGNYDFKKLIDDKESKVYYKVNNGVVNENNQTVILIGKRKKNTRILKLKI